MIFHDCTFNALLRPLMSKPRKRTTKLLQSLLPTSINTHVSSEQSTNGTTTITEEDPNEDLWTFLDSDEEDGSVGSFDDTEPQERTEDDGSPSLHSMVLLGHYVEDGTRYWLLQNSWVGPTQVIELSTDYFRQSEACLYFLGLRSPKDANIDSCASPISESSQLERSDCKDWIWL